MELDAKGIKQLQDMLSKRMSKTIQVGWFEGENTNPSPKARYKDTSYIAQVMYYGDETGIADIPPRPFFDHLASIRRDDTLDILKSLTRKVMKGDKNLQSEAQAAGKLVSDIINDFSDPPNSNYTIEIKGEDNPLVESGNLRDSVKGRIV